MTDETFFRKAPIGLARVDRYGSWFHVNRRMCDILGLSAETLRYLRIHHVTHPDDLEVELEQMQRLLREGHGRFNIAKRFIRGDGSIVWADLNVSYEQAEGANDGHFLSVVQDISQTREQIDQLEHKLLHDPLTRIRNRAGFNESISNAHRRFERLGQGFALAYIDLDGFKKINDTLGHVSGDQLLKDVADRLHRVVGRDGTVARMSGDEFAVVLTNVSSFDEMDAAKYRLQSVFSSPFETNDRYVPIRASIGLALCPGHARTIRGLMQHADEAMYTDKNADLTMRFTSRLRQKMRAAR